METLITETRTKCQHRWQFGGVVMALGKSSKLLYVRSS